MGKVSRDFIIQLTHMIELINFRNTWEPLALNMIHVFIPIMLQKPTIKSNSKVNAEYLKNCLIEWKNLVKLMV